MTLRENFLAPIKDGNSIKPERGELVSDMISGVVIISAKRTQHLGKTGDPSTDRENLDRHLNHSDICIVKHGDQLIKSHRYIKVTRERTRRVGTLLEVLRSSRLKFFLEGPWCWPGGVIAYHGTSSAVAARTGSLRGNISPEGFTS